MLKRHEIEVLLKAGHPKVEVAGLAGVSVSSVKRIAEEAPVVQVDDAAERVKRRIGRPSRVENFRKLVAAILAENADLPSVEVLRRVREGGYPGGKSALYGLVASLRSRRSSPWCGSRVCLGNSASMTLGRRTWSFGTDRHVASAFCLTPEVLAMDSRLAGEG
jgi:hypothetical protein